MRYDMSNGFLPISKQDMIDEGIEQLDFVYVCGDAYVDHPSFGHAIIARLLQAHGYTVGIISQPDWKDDESISILGVPRLGFFISMAYQVTVHNGRIIRSLSHHATRCKGILCSSFL